MGKNLIYIRRNLRLLLMRMLNNASLIKEQQEPSINKEPIPLKMKNNVHLISLHIPKTAGTSLYKILSDVYGKNKITRLDYRPNLNKLFLNEKEFNQKEFPAGVEVIHGHIRPNALEKYIDLNDNVKIITWIRDPVKRVISDYYYLLQIVDQNFNFDPYNPKVLNRITKSLIEFARMEVEQNRMSRFLGKTKLDDLFFVGTTENFDDDVKRLAQLLNWGSYNLVNENKTKNKASHIEQGVIEEIRSLNSLDVALYNQALKLKGNILQT